MEVRAQWMGDKIKGQVRSGVVSGLLAGAEKVVEASREVAPRETGELRNSAYADVDPDTLIAIAGYDVPRDIKSIKQHEDLSYHHPAGEQAKFLEKPLKDFGAAGLSAAVADELRKVFGG